ncbi:hypothetical protein GCM10010109_51810 [Actinoplanes campanulatus]|nr:hypothetical protein GCM10010109_51810 [Actinoplanes campanulatus]GID41331.1 hypothetical protein Aca09nite_78370 [Actinoplanes campanulatus]
MPAFPTKLLLIYSALKHRDAAHKSGRGLFGPTLLWYRPTGSRPVRRCAVLGSHRTPNTATSLPAPARRPVHRHIAGPDIASK